MRLKTFALFLFGALFSGNMAFADDCLITSPVINFKETYHGYSVSRSLNKLALKSYNVGSHKGSGEVLGLTISNLKTDLQMEVESRQLSRNLWCSTPKSINFKFGQIEKVLVYIASEIRAGSCEDRTTLQHELQHVAFTEAAILSARSRIVPAIHQALKGRTYKGRTVAGSQAELQRAVSDSIRKQIDIIIQEMEARHASIDTADNYERTAAICRGR